MESTDPPTMHRYQESYYPNTSLFKWNITKTHFDLTINSRRVILFDTDFLSRVQAPFENLRFTLRFYHNSIINIMEFKLKVTDNSNNNFHTLNLHFTFLISYIDRSKPNLLTRKFSKIPMFHFLQLHQSFENLISKLLKTWKIFKIWKSLTNKIYE